MPSTQEILAMAPNAVHLDLDENACLLTVRIASQSLAPKVLKQVVRACHNLAGDFGVGIKFFEVEAA